MCDGKRYDLILIVDDEMDICWSLEYILNKHGFHTATTTKAHAALSLLSAQKFRLVFVDAKLPDMDGLELAKHIRRIDAYIGIVLISGYFYEDDVSVQQAISEGAISEFISKPFLQEEIMQLVGKLLPRSAAV